ncbi:MAG: 7-carboxy-7-deazaguanine synthase QueE [Endomicrobiales bacterium]
MRTVNAVLKAPISEIFLSHQGEGIFIGEPQVFVRFVGCNLRCDYCDTSENQTINENQKYFSVENILVQVKKLSGGKPITVSLTGGEPLLYSGFLSQLLPALKKIKCRTYLESNGTLPELYRKIARWVDIVAMDVKVASACGANYWSEHKDFLMVAKSKVFVKLVITDKTTVAEATKAAAVVRSVSLSIPFILQIASTVKKCKSPSPETVFILTQAVRKKIPHAYPCPQMHKIWDVR